MTVTAVRQITYFALCAFVFINDVVSWDDYLARLVFCESTSYSYSTDNEHGEGTVLSPGYPEVMADFGRSLPSQCSINITACPFCRIHISDVQILCSGYRSCAISQCLYMREPGYEYLPKKWITLNTYKFTPLDSNTRTVQLVLNTNNITDFNLSFTFKFSIRAAPNTILRGSIGETGTISSLGFPRKYATNGDRFTFYIDSVSAGFIRLNFSDWFLSKDSKVKVYRDGVRSAMSRITYNSVDGRPFVVSSGSDILIDFETGSSNTDEVYVGFKAVYEIVEGLYWRNKPTEVGNSILSNTFGGQISVNSLNSVDYIWVIPRSDILDQKAQLKLKINQASNIKPYQLEIHRGITSEGEAVSWNINSSIVEKSGLYVRLQHSLSVAFSAPVTFSAVFTWTKPIFDPELQTNDCRSLGDFQCLRSAECVSSTLKCDGIKNCDDGSDEEGCNGLISSCNSYFKCKRGTRIICAERICNGIRDCMDSSDELDCTSSTATTTEFYNDWVVNHHYGTFSVTVPVVIVTIVIIIIVCFTISFNVRRRLQLRNLHRAARVLRQHQDSASASSDNEVPYSGQNIMGGRHYLMGVNPSAPPSYDDTVLYANQGFATMDGAPPAYNAAAAAKPNDDPLANQTDSTDPHLPPPPPYSPAEQGTNVQHSDRERTTETQNNN